MKKQTKLIIAVAVIVAVVVVMAGIYFATRPDTAQGAKTITVEVVHGDGSSKEFTYHTDSEYLGEVLLAEGLVAGDQGEFGLYIHTVDGEDAIFEESGAYWALYQDGEMTTTGADATPIQDGDSFQLVYTK